MTFVSACIVLQSVFLSSTALGQTPCDEPQDPAYLDRMEQVSVAIEQSDFESVLANLEWAIERYDYAALEYGRARALHNLDRFADAEEAYNRFLRQFEGCPDPDMLIISARQYRSLAVQEQASALESDPNQPTNRDGTPVTPQNGSSSGQPSTAENPDLVAEDSASKDGIDPGWFVLGGGVVLILTGIIYDLSKAHLIDDQQAAYDRGDTEEWYRLEDEIQRARTVDIVLYSTGLVAAGVGVVLLLTGGDEQASSNSSVDFEASATRAMVRYRLRF